MKETKNSVLSGLTLAFDKAVNYFLNSKIIKRQTQIANLEGVEIIRSDGANHFKNGEAVGGKLYLMEDKLQFQSHKFNIQNHGLEIPLEQISKIRFFKTLGLVANGLEIQTSDGKIEKFVISDRNIWRDEIEKTKKRA